MKRNETEANLSGEAQLKSRFSGIVRGIEEIQTLKDNSLRRGRAGAMPGDGDSLFGIGKYDSGQPVFTAKMKSGNTSRFLTIGVLKGYGFIYSYIEEFDSATDNTSNNPQKKINELTPAKLDDFDRAIRKQIAMMHGNSGSTSGV